MPKKTYLAIIIIIVLAVASVAAFYVLQTPQENNTEPTSTTKAGVKAGDTFTYEIIGISETSSEDVTTPENFLDVNKTDYYRIEITKVEDPIVSYNVTWQFNNGTKYSYSSQINIDTGAYTQDFWGIYTANLTQGSLSRPGYPEGATVNATETRTYLDGDRQTNILRMNGEFYDSSDLTYTKSYLEYTYVDFDSQTGMLVELKDMKIYTNPDIILTVEWKLVDSNVLQVS
jgi:uncharacterized protein (UPF0333 family)